jgi:hypothetical protein
MGVSSRRAKCVESTLLLLFIRAHSSFAHQFLLVSFFSFHALFFSLFLFNLEMSTVHGAVLAAFGAAIGKAFPESSFVPIVTLCGNQKNGHYQCNNAMPIFKKMKGKEGAPTTPVEVAEVRASPSEPTKLSPSNDFIKRAHI